MYVIGTAGHVDHGKSTLVKALTGIDPDRLKEEQEREMTIDLGFAWLQLPNGEEVGVVDVPGHERFVKNMLAGVGGIDLAMLIVAADEGVMPQTREHLAILDLLRVKKGVGVITKKDLVDADFLELVTGDVEQLLRGTALEGSPVVAVSSLTGDGLPKLKQTLVEALEQTPQRKDVGAPRLPIDRAFIMTGFGPVVTGTLIDGTFEVGQEVEIVPAGLKARIRGLQSHRKKLDTATPGRRLAVNLSGVNYEDLHRGQVLTTPGMLVSTAAFDARLRMVGDTVVSLRHGASVIYYCGTFESPATVRLLDKDELAAGEVGWVQIKTGSAAPTVKGDLFILRDSRGTLAGGEIVEPRAKRHRRFQESLLEHLEVLEQGTSEDVVLEALAGSEPSQAKALAAATNLGVEEVRAAVAKLVDTKRIVTLGERVEPLLFTSAGFKKLKERTAVVLAELHQKFPLRKGIAKEELRSRLELPASAFGLVLATFAADGDIVDEGSAVGLGSHKPGLGESAAKQAEQYLRELNAHPYSPASDVTIDPEVVAYLVDQGRVVKASSDVYFTAQAYAEMVDKILALAKDKGSFTVAQARDLFGNSRKYTLALLEHMDQQRITRRVGDERTVRQP